MCPVAALRETQDQYTALIYAAENGNVDCARLLIEAGADADAKDDVRRQPLFCVDLLVFSLLSYICVQRVVFLVCFCFYACCVHSSLIHCFIICSVRYILTMPVLLSILLKKYVLNYLILYRYGSGEARRLFVPLRMVTRTVCGCCWIPAPKRLPRTVYA